LVIRVLSVASEMAPWIKTGGLADVVGALPTPLKSESVKMVALLPFYGDIKARLNKADMRVMSEYGDCFGGSAQLLKLNGIENDVIFMDAPHLFGFCGNPYTLDDGTDRPDGDVRFAALSWMAAQVAAHGLSLDVNSRGLWFPDIIHTHDWQTGLVPHYCSQSHLKTPVLFTVHNAAFQGLTTFERSSKLRISPEISSFDNGEFWGKLSFLKAGLNGANFLTTVSPSYAEELKTAKFSYGLEGVFQRRSDSFSGILNGIDTSEWDPKKDLAIKPFNTPSGKLKNRKILLEKFGLGEAIGPIFGVISRLSHQKGLDVLLDALPVLHKHDARLILIGSGDPELEYRWRRAADTSEHVAAHIGFDEDLARLVYAGATSILLPSRFEPCGLSQLIGMRYGALPVVNSTGGLIDTVVHMSPMAERMGTATGYVMQQLNSEMLGNAMGKIAELSKDKLRLEAMQQNAMQVRVDWSFSAKEYANLYKYLLQAS
jgi:starch synthase